MEIPAYNEGMNYYKEYWRAYLENEQLMSTLQQEQNEVLELQRKINKIQVCGFTSSLWLRAIYEKLFKFLTELYTYI